MKNSKLSHIRIFLVAIPVLVAWGTALSQASDQFDVSLRVDYSSIDGLIDLCEHRIGNPDRIADLKGNQIAAATSELLARKNPPPGSFNEALGKFRDNAGLSDDMYGLERTRRLLPKIKALLDLAKKRSFERRVVATVASFFPTQTAVSLSVPVYVVAMGNENAAAFVRHLYWDKSRPVFVGDVGGEPAMVVNLARMVEQGGDVQSQMVELLSTVAHETFHAVFSTFKATSPAWQDTRRQNDPFWMMADLVQNEGIAYYISLEEHAAGRTLTKDWFEGTGRAMKTLDGAMIELRSPDLSMRRARDLLQNANLSGAFERNFGATAGLRMAYEIDMRAGRPALTQSILDGPQAFFAAYDALCKRQGELPRLSDRVNQAFSQ